MNRSFYFVAIFLLAVTCTTALYQNFLFSQLSGELFFLGAFPQWFVVVKALSLLCSLLLALYFYYNRYIVTFYCFLLSSITTYVNVAILYSLFTSRTLESYYLASFVAWIAGNMIFATSLIFFTTDKRLWFNLAGLWLLILNIFSASALVYGHFKGVTQMSDTFEKINLAVSFAYNMLPLFFIINFLFDLKNTKANNNTFGIQTSFVVLVGLVGGVGFILSVISGTMVRNQTLESLYWKKKLAEQDVFISFNKRITNPIIYSSGL